jgi:predicted Zn-dependent protease
MTKTRGGPFGSLFIGVPKQSLIYGVLGLYLMLGGCMTAQSASQLGRSEHPRVVAASGGIYNRPAVSSYVARVGQKVATRIKGETGAETFTFTTLDSPAVNAFALPGGYVYVTRGLLALVNDEAELAGVLGHEITHVTQAHTAERYNRSQVAGIGAMLIGLATGSEDLMKAAGYGSQLFLLNYSRDQEFQSDRRGIGLIDRAGYDPYAMGDFLGAMGAQSALSAKIAGRDYDPGRVDYFSTHPNTEQRVSQAWSLARERGAVRGEKLRGRDTYLSQIDGILYGDSPDQGFVRGRKFSHPVMKFEFEAPEGFTLQNTSGALTGNRADGVSFQFDAAPDYKSGGLLVDYLRQTWAPKLQITIGPVRQMSPYGIAMASAEASVQTGKGPVDVRLVALAHSPTRVYRFLIIMPAGKGRSLSPEIDQMLASYRRLSSAKAAALKPLWLRVVRVKSGDTVAGLADKMAFDDYREERFRALNNMKAGDTLRAGRKVKIVTR